MQFIKANVSTVNSAPTVLSMNQTMWTHHCFLLFFQWHLLNIKKGILLSIFVFKRHTWFSYDDLITFTANVILCVMLGKR